MIGKIYLTHFNILLIRKKEMDDDCIFSLVSRYTMRSMLIKYKDLPTIRLHSNLKRIYIL